MEGNARIEAQDSIALDSRFQVLFAIDYFKSGREKGI